MHDLRLLFLELRVRYLLYPCFKENRGIMLLDLQLIEKCTTEHHGVYSCGAHGIYPCEAPWRSYGEHLKVDYKK